MRFGVSSTLEDTEKQNVETQKWAQVSDYIS